jgi:hypothetical protein
VNWGVGNNYRAGTQAPNAVQPDQWRFIPAAAARVLNGQRINGMKPFEINRWAVAQFPEITNIFLLQRVRELCVVV